MMVPAGTAPGCRIIPCPWRSRWSRADLPIGNSERRGAVGYRYASAGSLAFSRMTLQTHDARDITIIGGGPTGIRAGSDAASTAWRDIYADHRRAARARRPAYGAVIEKYIFDVAGFRKILVKHLVKEQAGICSVSSTYPPCAAGIVGLEEENGISCWSPRIAALSVEIDRDRCRHRRIFPRACFHSRPPQHGTAVASTISSPIPSCSAIGRSSSSVAATFAWPAIGGVQLLPPASRESRSSGLERSVSRPRCDDRRVQTYGRRRARGLPSFFTR